MTFSVPIYRQNVSYTFTPGKLTGKEFFLEQEKLRCREVSFEQFLLFPKPKETVDLRISLRGGYRAHDLFGHEHIQGGGTFQSGSTGIVKG